jgi:hypothetical protein
MTPPQNQMAHEVTRDVTAWASFSVATACSGIGPILLATCSWAWARLGPLSVIAGLLPNHTDG